jgi:hypothetical protein
VRYRFQVNRAALLDNRRGRGGPKRAILVTEIGDDGGSRCFEARAVTLLGPATLAPTDPDGTGIDLRTDGPVQIDIE